MIELFLPFCLDACMQWPILHKCISVVNRTPQPTHAGRQGRQGVMQLRHTADRRRGQQPRWPQPSCSSAPLQLQAADDLHGRVLRVSLTRAPRTVQCSSPRCMANHRDPRHACRCMRGLHCAAARQRAAMGRGIVAWHDSGRHAILRGDACINSPFGLVAPRCPAVAAGRLRYIAAAAAWFAICL